MKKLSTATTFNRKCPITGLSVTFQKVEENTTPLFSSRVKYTGEFKSPEGFIAYPSENGFIVDLTTMKIWVNKQGEFLTLATNELFRRIRLTEEFVVMHISAISGILPELQMLELSDIEISTFRHKLPQFKFLQITINGQIFSLRVLKDTLGTDRCHLSGVLVEKGEVKCPIFIYQGMGGKIACIVPDFEIPISPGMVRGDYINFTAYVPRAKASS